MKSTTVKVSPIGKPFGGELNLTTIRKADIVKTKFVRAGELPTHKDGPHTVAGGNSWRSSLETLKKHIEAHRGDFS